MEQRSPCSILIPYTVQALLTLDHLTLFVWLGAIKKLIVDCSRTGQPRHQTYHSVFDVSDLIWIHLGFTLFEHGQKLSCEMKSEPARGALAPKNHQLHQLQPWEHLCRDRDANDFLHLQMYLCTAVSYWLHVLP